MYTKNYYRVSVETLRRLDFRPDTCIFRPRRFLPVKLYSRGQVLLAAAAAAVLLLAAAAAAGFLKLPGGRSGREAAERPAAEQAPAAPLPLPVQYSGPVSADEANNIDLYQRLNPAVVNITSVSFEYNWFLEPVPQQGTGSGSIIDPKGHVLTNYHVVKDASELSVTLAGGADYKGRIVGVDPENDLAVIQFDPKGARLTVIPFGSSSGLRVGQKVLAIGNPFGLDRTLTTGIISGLGRPVKTESGIVIREMIQTDASINPGNSGGPLLNSKGEMIGVNTMIYSPSGGSVGIGFAVPIETARRVVPDLLRFGKVQRGWIDIKPVQLFPRLVSYANLPVSEGVLVSEVTPGSTAEKAGLKGGGDPVRYGRSLFYLGGDIIVEVDRMPVSSLYDLLGALEDNKPGETVEVKILRNRRPQTLTVQLSQRPQDLQW
jgi:S1-C subfamily serine protease